ncbi:hypothetical protein OAV42_00085 [Ilumatobacter sp.]|nr:hypothetical protein [Ilumatobacter sp.]
MHILGSSIAFFGLIAVALRDVVDIPWFEDDAMITFAYSKNLTEGCGWNFNCGGDDFATSSYLHTVIGALWFAIADTARALHIEKLWENMLVVWGAAAYLVSSVRLGTSRVAALAAVAIVLLMQNSFQFLFSGMENALGFFVLSCIVLAYSYDRLRIVGVLVGVVALVRPEYVIAGVILALLDLMVRYRMSETVVWLKSWVWPAVIALGSFLPLFAFVWVANGAPFADTLEIKRLTAPNWGALYHEELWRLAKPLGPGLVVLALGLVGLILKRSPLLFWPAFAFFISLIYAMLGLPRSPWYYMPFWAGLASCVLGVPHMYRTFKSAWQLDTKRIPGWIRSATAGASALALVIISIGNPVDVGAENIDLVSRVAKKRQSINKSTGIYLKQVSDSEDRVALPNIGYVGFYSERFIVDLVGLVTPDAGLRVSADRWRDYDPAYYIDKAHIAERLLELQGYSFVRLKGDRNYRSERFVVLERSVEAMGSSVSAQLVPENAVATSSGWTWLEVPDLRGISSVSLPTEQVYLSAGGSASKCGASGVIFRIDADGRSDDIPSYYVNRLGYSVADISTATDVDWAGIESLSVVGCVDGAKSLESAPSLYLAIAGDPES